MGYGEEVCEGLNLKRGTTVNEGERMLMLIGSRENWPR
jgi:hypothetical protein